MAKWKLTIVQEFKAELAGRDKLIADLKAIVGVQAAALAKVENNVSVIQQTPQDIPTADDIARQLTHSATWERLDGKIETQTRPLNEPLKFKSERVGIR